MAYGEIVPTFTEITLAFTLHKLKTDLIFSMQ